MSGKNDPRSENCGIWKPEEWKKLTERPERPEGDSNKNNSDDNPEGGRRK